jgi:hypothetical protein
MRITTSLFKLGLVSLGLACAPSALLLADPQDRPEAKQPADEGRRPAPADDGEPGPSAGYWIGVQCSPIHDPALRAQLDLDRDQGGLLVEDVLPDSPAAKAGLKLFDVLLTAGDSRLRDMHMLQRAINRAAGSELKIELYRGGKQQSVTVKPAERGEQSGPEGAFVQPPPDALQQWLEHRWTGLPWTGPPHSVPPQSMYFFGPGVVLPPAERGLPDDMSVTIVRKGKEPAKVIVKQGDQTWEATEDKLSELPPPVRHEVDKLLPRQMPPRVRPEAAPFPSGELNEMLQRQQRDIKAQLDQVRKRLERLERQTPPGRESQGDDKR